MRWTIVRAGVIRKTADAETDWSAGDAGMILTNAADCISAQLVSCTSKLDPPVDAAFVVNNQVYTAATSQERKELNAAFLAHLFMTHPGLRMRNDSGGAFPTRSLLRGCRRSCARWAGRSDRCSRLARVSLGLSCATQRLPCSKRKEGARYPGSQKSPHAH
jgi:hypothetical protein